MADFGIFTIIMLCVNSLHHHIKGQDEGRSAIISALIGWESQKMAGLSQPLVLAITGPTGVVLSTLFSLPVIGFFLFIFCSTLAEIKNIYTNFISTHQYRSLEQSSIQYNV